MKLHELRPPKGSRRARKRVGRGTGSGLGKTAGRGTKGQGARTSYNIPRNFEGGQTKLAMRVPKLRGFNNRWKRTYSVVNLTRLNRFQEGTEVTPELLLESGAIKDVGAGIKVLGTGELSRRLTVHAHRFSASATRKIAAAGGSTSTIPAPPKQLPKNRRAQERLQGEKSGQNLQTGKAPQTEE
jgi:large subunit ribosomal protein L15